MSLTFILAVLLQIVEFNQFVQSRITGATPTTRNPNNCSNEEIADDLNQEDFINMLTNPCKYDKFSRPNSNSGPTKISVKIDIKQIEILNQLQFKINIDAQYCYQDERLRYNKSSPKRGETTGGSKLLDKIWMPHIVLNDERDTSVLEIASKDVFISISPLGNVAYSFRLSAVIYCWMDLEKFPFDQQICEVHFKSWSFNTSQLILNWAEENPVNINRGLRLAEFEMIKNWTSNSTVPSSTIRGTKGNYSVLIFKFQLSREIGFYILDYFLPSIMLVCISWVTFWLQPDYVAPRITLGTSTMLTFITLTSGHNKSIPRVSHINASAIWFLACAFFIFASIAEFAFVNIIWRRKGEVELKKPSSKHILKSAVTPKLARKELYRTLDKYPSCKMNKSQTLRSLDSLYSRQSNTQEDEGYNNYLTVQSLPSTVRPIFTVSDSELDPSITSIVIPTSDDDPRRTSFWTIKMTPQEIAIWIDKRSRIVFPLAFLFFNLIYWVSVSSRLF